MKKWNTADPQRETWNWIARSPKQSQHKAQPGQGSFYNQLPEGEEVVAERI
jgi:hypothetical protein